MRRSRGCIPTHQAQHALPATPTRHFTNNRHHTSPRPTAPTNPDAAMLPAPPPHLPTRLLDQWEQVEPDQPPIVIPMEWCAVFPAWYCPLPVDTTWGALSRVPEGCVMQRWLVPNGCVLPPPTPIWTPLLGRWERRSQPLKVNNDAQQSIEDFLGYFKKASGGWVAAWGGWGWRWAEGGREAEMAGQRTGPCRPHLSHPHGTHTTTTTTTHTLNRPRRT